MIRTKRRNDRGMTLPEVLIAFTMMGLLSAVLSAAISVTLNQSKSTEGRANVARAESSIDTWLPADLASTDVNNETLPAVDLDVNAVPCQPDLSRCGSIDMSGVNAMQLAWESAGVVTRVQYQYIEVNGEWQVQRIFCRGTEMCLMTVILHDLEGPSDPADFALNPVRPIWVMDVAVPTDPVGLDLSDNARQIVVTIDGGGETEGAGGGVNKISLTAGGRSTEEIDADDFTVPSFVRAKSRCGGPVTLVIDDSKSININSSGNYISPSSSSSDNNLRYVIKPGARAFIEAFRGTPTQIQVIKFSSEAQAIGPNIESSPANPGVDTTANGGWHRYIDMTNDAQVDQLLAAVESDLVANGGTNWEEAFFHTFKEFDGSEAQISPNRLVFFTDGIPTRNRAVGSSYRNGAEIDYNDGPYTRVYDYYNDYWGWLQSTGGDFHQESWDRADKILDDNRSTDLIFVGVGAGLQSNDNIWTHNPAVYTDRDAPRGAHSYRTGEQVLSYLVANAPGIDPSGAVLADYDSTANEYTNPETANLYIQSEFDADAFAASMRAAALKDCGGTLTMQTRLDTGARVDDELVFENVEYRNDEDVRIEADPRRVTTSRNFPTGTFDFDIASTSDFYNVDVVPQELQTLSGYESLGWTCRAGAVDKTSEMTAIPIEGSSFSGFTVPVAANEAVSCVLTVRVTP